MGGHCLAWLLLVTYICVTCFTGGAMVWTFIGMKHNETDNNSSKVEVEPTMEHHGPWSPYSHRFTDDEDGRDRMDNLLVITPCGTSAAVALLIAFIGIGTRNIFRTTQAIHGSLLLVIVHIIAMMVLLLKWEPPLNFQWIVEINVLAIAVCIIQIVIGVTYLRWQKKTWITFNFKQLFTLDSCFFMGRTVVGVYLIQEFVSRMYWFVSRTCYDINVCPPWGFYFCAVSLITGIVLNLQCLLSVYFGSLHRFFAVLSSLILTVGYGCMSILVSPLYLSTIYNDRWYTVDSCVFSVILFSLHIIHLILLIVVPNVMANSLFDIKLNNLEALRALPCLKAFTHEESQSSHSGHLMMRKTFKYNMISLIGSVVTLALITIYLWYPAWSLIVLTSINVSLLSRSLNGVISEAITLQVDTIVPQALLFNIIEGFAALVGFIGVCTRGDAGPIVGGVGLLCIYAMKFWQHRESTCEILNTVMGDLSNKRVQKESDSLPDTLTETEAPEKA